MPGWPEDFAAAYRKLLRPYRGQPVPSLDEVREFLEPCIGDYDQKKWNPQTAAAWQHELGSVN